MYAAWMLLVMATRDVPWPLVVTDHVAVIELNHCYDATDLRLRFDQLIFWDWYQGATHVVAWRLVTGGRARLSEAEFNRRRRDFEDRFLKDNPNWPWQLPRYTPPYVSSVWPMRLSQCRYVVVFLDGACIRKVYGVVAIETWTTYDPEFEDRSLLPRQRRRQLTPVRDW